MNDTQALLYFDGRCTGNGTEYAQGFYGWLLIAAGDGDLIWSGKGRAGSGPGMTNHVAEYAALLAGLRALLDREDLEAVEVRGDSELVIRQMAGSWGCYAPNLQPLHQEALTLIRQLEAGGCAVRLRWIPGKENREADQLAREAAQEVGPPRVEGDGYTGAGDPVAVGVALG
jgi:probable phosphoglycerate mutase